MQWYDDGRFYWSGDKVMTTTKCKTDKIEYAETKHVHALATRVTVLEERESEIINQVAKDKKNIEDALEQIRYNYQAVRDLQWRVRELEDAPSVAKRKRRVTICAGDQKVEVIKL